jgi:hypothetical protein
MHEPRIVATSGDTLDEELARRLVELRQIAPDADCAAGSRPIVVPALVWLLIGFAIWFAGAITLT